MKKLNTSLESPNHVVLPYQRICANSKWKKFYDLAKSNRCELKLRKSEIQPGKLNFQNFDKIFRLFFTKGLLHASVLVAWERSEVLWKGLILKFSKKNFQNFWNFFCAKIFLRFSVGCVFFPYFYFYRTFQTNVL